MGRKHSKNGESRHHYSYHEKQSMGTVKQRLGTDSQLPFGYCALSLCPAEEPVVSPSGHIYSREAILEYLLTKTRDIKRIQQQFDAEQQKVRDGEAIKEVESQSRAVEAFVQQESGDVSALSASKRKAGDAGGSSETAVETSSQLKKHKLMDETSTADKIEALKTVCPWIVQFTPSAPDAPLTKEFMKEHARPASPCSGRPLRAKDLIPIRLERDDGSGGSGLGGSSSGTGVDNSGRVDNNGGTVRFMCPVSRKTITNQKVVLLRNTGVVMTEDTYESLVKPTMVCPITSRRFEARHVLQVAQAASGFASTGKVETSKYKPSIN
jgi:nitric oxide synthase-interacting protein